MEIFVSWSGARSKHIAEALAAWLPDVIQSTRPFISTGMDSGIRWLREIEDRLTTSAFGIICLTPDNVDAPWILFEAGALALGLPDRHVVPYLLDLSPSDVKMPLGQFNAVEATKADTLKLVKTINSQLGEGRLSEERLQTAFGRNWPDLERNIAATPKAEAQAPEPRDDRDLLVEILNVVRDLARARAMPSVPRPLQPVSSEDLLSSNRTVLEATYKVVASWINVWRTQSPANEVDVGLRRLGDTILVQFEGREAVAVVPTIPSSLMISVTDTPRLSEAERRRLRRQIATVIEHYPDIPVVVVNSTEMVLPTPTRMVDLQDVDYVYREGMMQVLSAELARHLAAPEDIEAVHSNDDSRAPS